MLYVGKARDLRARLRSYFAGDRQRPAVEAALGALARVEWRELGSELEAALEELRLIRELRPPANARGGRPQSYLRRRGERWVVVRGADALRPDREQAAGAARGPRARRLRGRGPRGRASAAPREAAPARPRPSLRGRGAAARPGRRARGGRGTRRGARPAARRGAVRARARPRAGLLARLRRRGWARASHGRSRAGAAGRLEIQACLAAATAAEPSLAPEDAADLLVVSGFVRKPPPELRIVPLRLAEIQAA